MSATGTTVPSPDAALQAADREAMALLRARRVADAQALYARLVAVAPDQPWLLAQQGAALLLGTDTEQARRHFESLTQRFPDFEAAWQGLGKALLDAQECGAAIAAFSRAAAISRAPARALYHRGMARLMAGDFAAGWWDYEHRLAVPGLERRPFAQPLWEGGDLAGRRLLVTCEQGYGDVFQFIRFLRPLRERAGHLIFECPAELRSLLAPLLEGWEVVALRGTGPPDIGFDVHAPLLSLPFLLGTTAQRFSPDGPYLFATPAVQHWPERKFRIGVCWAGNPGHPQDLHRSMAPELLAPLARMPGVALHSLQKPATNWPPVAGLDAFLHPPPCPLVDFTATARAIMALDLVVTVDTAVAHLAGALGRPVWLMLARAAEWRWLLGRSDTPWYPSMRLFRQARLGDWDGVVADIAAALPIAR